MVAIWEHATVSLLRFSRALVLLAAHLLHGFEACGVSLGRLPNCWLEQLWFLANDSIAHRDKAPPLNWAAKSVIVRTRLIIFGWCSQGGHLLAHVGVLP